MKLTKRLSEHKNKLLWPALLWTGIILYLCLINMNDLPTVAIDNFDKFGHATFHFVMTSLWFLYFRFRRENSMSLSMKRGFLISFCFGVSVELMQTFFTTTRTGDIFDVMANTVGGLLAVWLMYSVFGKNAPEAHNLKTK